MRLLLFDIDGTLLLSGGAGSSALRLALREVCGLADGMEEIQPHGKTDPAIIREALERNGNGLKPTHDVLTSLFACYVSFLRQEIDRSNRFVVLPGVRELLVRLQRESRLLLGIATGNIEEGARIKLEHADLSQFFSFGGYGSDAENRTEVIQTALQRGLDRIHPAVPETVVVVGDTPRDIIHGKQARARTLAVASGHYPLEELKTYQPDLAVASLNPVEPLLSFLTA